MARFPTKADYFASYSGTAPLETSSGDVVRHRLSRNGDDTTDGQAGGDTLVGGSGHDRIIAGTGNNHHVFARDGQQDLICVDPNSSGSIETEDPQDRFIFNRSC